MSMNLKNLKFPFPDWDSDNPNFIASQLNRNMSNYPFVSLASELTNDTKLFSKIRDTYDSVNNFIPFEARYPSIHDSLYCDSDSWQYPSVPLFFSSDFGIEPKREEYGIERSLLPNKCVESFHHINPLHVNQSYVDNFLMYNSPCENIFEEQFYPLAYEGRVLDISKARVVWNDKMREAFNEAVSVLGGADKATPKPILALMQKKGIKNINREHVASHLQKYRKKAKK